jgi:hypothetical protein
LEYVQYLEVCLFQQAYTGVTYISSAVVLVWQHVTCQAVDCAMAMGHTSVALMLKATPSAVPCFIMISDPNAGVLA